MTSFSTILPGFDGVDSGGFGGEDLCGAEVVVFFVNDEAGIDGGALDDGAFGGEVADGEADSGGETAGSERGRGT